AWRIAPTPRRRRSEWVTVHAVVDSVAVDHEARAPYASRQPQLRVTPPPIPVESPAGSAAGKPTTTPPSTARSPPERTVNASSPRSRPPSAPAARGQRSA